MQDIDFDQLTKALKLDARGLGIPDGAADSFIERSIKAAKKSLKSKQIITEKDLTHAITKELKKYNADFAYVYENRDTII